MSDSLEVDGSARVPGGTSTRVLAIVGPTAVGKTQLSLDVAEELDAEIVSVDSMQIYRGMDIGTDKLPADQRRGIPHHLIDLRDPDHELTVSEYQEVGRAAIDEISARGKVPLLVGGSGLYFRAIVDDLKFPPRSDEVRSALEGEAEEVGVEALHARLSELDPAAAARIEPRNARRTIRALEVIELTGRPFSENTGWDDYTSIYDLKVVGLDRTREELFARIHDRVDEHLARGLVKEAHALEQQGMGRTARQALGYRQILDAARDADAERIREAIIKATKKFARRQSSWFKADPRVSWLDASSEPIPNVYKHPGFRP
jgi:tRNA dimethylallyltransferase